MEPTEDAQKKAALAEAQGNAYDEALAYMAKQDTSARAEIDDYIVTLACEEAEGMYFPSGENTLEWHKPERNRNAHVEVVVQDKADKRFIPGLEITVQLYDAEGSSVGDETVVPFLWHPFLYHYGKDWSVPDDGAYTARITIKQPQFGRHDSLIGKRYARTVSVDIGPVDIKTGRKPVGPE